MNRLVAIVGPTATGKSALAIAVAQAIGGEVIACDSTAVYRGIDIGTDKVPASAQSGIPHHMVDVVGVTAIYSAADYARDAAAVIRDVAGRGRVPILAGGTGFYYRALTRGLFPGPTRDMALRSRLDRVANVKGVEWLWRWLRRVDPASAARVMPRDQKRIVRALEVYLVTGRPMSSHFAETVSPIADFDVLTIGLELDRQALLPRVTARVDQQLASGVVDEVRHLIASGIPTDTHAFSGLVYRQIVELLRGLRELAPTRDLIIRENMRYARRQVLWFRREPGVHWVAGPGESPSTMTAVIDKVRTALDGTAVGTADVLAGSAGVKLAAASEV